MIRTYRVSVTVDGIAGSASGSASTYRPINGIITGVKLEFNSQASTADTVITDEDGQTILSLTNVNTNGWYYPHPEIHDNTGAELNKQTCPYTVNSYLSVAVSQSNAGSVDVTFLVNEGGR